MLPKAMSKTVFGESGCLNKEITYYPHHYQRTHVRTHILEDVRYESDTNNDFAVLCVQN